MRRFRKLRVQPMAIVLICYLLPTLGLGFYVGGAMMKDFQARMESALTTGMDYSLMLAEEGVQKLISLPQDATYDGESVHGTIDVLDVRFGSLWTNIEREQFERLGVTYGQRVEVTIEDGTRTVYRNFLTFARSFGDVFVGEPLVYVNSLDCMAVAINQGSFAKAYGIGTGTNWKLSLRKAPRLVYE